MKPLAADQVWTALRRGASARIDEGRSARFRAGDPVTVKDLNPLGHIRLPGYVRGRRGTIAADQGEFIFPDLHAQGIKVAQRLYSVRFEFEELWGTRSRDATYVDLFESYLDPA